MQRRVIVLGFLLLAAGCMAPSGGSKTVPFADADRARFYKRQKSPQVFGLTVYNSDNGPVISGAHRLHVGQSDLFKFDGPPLTDLRLNEQTWKALIDTTSADSWLTARCAAEGDVVPLAPPAIGRRADHVADDIGGMLALAPKARLGEIHVENALFYVRAASGPLGRLDRFAGKPPPDAVLGTTLLRAFSYVQVDLRHGAVLLSASRAFAPAEDRLIASVPLKTVEGALACEGLVDGQPQDVLLDVAGNFALVLADPRLDETRQVSLGDLVLRKLPTAAAAQFDLGLAEYPRIGRQLLGRFVITFDMRRNEVHFERPAP